MTLRELTSHTSGIIVYPDGAVLVSDWGRCDDDCLPILSPFGTLMPWAFEDGYLNSAKYERVADLRAALPGSIWLTDEVDDDGTPIADCDMDIVFDGNNDFPRLFLAADLDPDELVAHVYTLDDGTKVIAPVMWA